MPDYYAIVHAPADAKPRCFLRAGLLERVLFANIRFHDTINRGRLLNRFAKDFEGMLSFPRFSAVSDVTQASTAV